MELEINGITKSFGKKSVLRGASMRAHGGMCVGILGGNGCGKSTLLSILAGIQRADGGSFTVDGAELLSDPKRRRELVGYVPQGTPLIPELTAKDNLLLWYSRRELEASLREGVLKTLGVGAFLATPVKKLSGGMKKRLSIGCAMNREQSVLLLDEPTAALDLECREDVAAYLAKRRADGGLTIMTTHEVPELEVCEALYVLHDGALQPFTFTGDVRRLIDSF